MSPFIGAPLVLLGTGFLFALVGVLKYRYALSREWSRKLVHIGVGLIALSFPWTLVDTRAVVVVSALGSVALFLVQRSRWLGRQVDGIIAVRRLTFGELFFPATVGLLYVLARGDEILYVIPLLVLTFADAAAAVIGMHYGALHYSTEEGWKSAEGSMVFFMVAFLSTLVPLLLFTDTGRADTLLIAFLAAFISMLVEAVCTRGFDNILVPLITFLVVQSSLAHGTAELILQVTVGCGMLAAVFLTRPLNTLSGSALLGTVLVGFLCWTFGGWKWLLAPLLTFAANAAVHIDPGTRRPVTAQFTVVRRVSEAGLVWLFVAAMLHRDELIIPFVAAFSAQLSMLGMRQLRILAPASQGVTIVLVSTVASWMIVCIPLMWLGVVRGDPVKIGAAFLAVTLAASVVFYRKLMGVQPELDAPRPWRTQALCGGLASVLMLVPLYLI